MDLDTQLLQDILGHTLDRGQRPNRHEDRRLDLPMRCKQTSGTARTQGGLDVKLNRHCLELYRPDVSAGPASCWPGLPTVGQAYGTRRGKPRPLPRPCAPPKHSSVQTRLASSREARCAPSVAQTFTLQS